MDKNVQGNAEEVVLFSNLEQEEGQEEPLTKRLESMLKLLKEKLSPADYAAACATLGVKKDLTNTELLAEFEKLLAKKKKDEENVDEEKLSYKDFMGKCMKEGKSMADCASEYKKKYPTPEKQPKAAEIAEVEVLAAEIATELAKKGKEICPKCGKPMDQCTCTGKGDKYPYPPEYKKKLEDLEASNKALLDRMDAVEKEKGTAVLGAKVDALVLGQHITPKMKDGVLKFATNLPIPMQDEYLASYRSQKFLVSQDVGGTESGKPGQEKMTPEHRKEVLHKFGLDDLIAERADKTRLSKEMKEALN